MRAVFIIYQRLKIENTKEIHQITNEFHQLTNESYQYTKEIHRYTYEIYLITKESQQNTNEQHLITNESYCSTNDGFTHMMTATLINGALLSATHECGFLPLRGLWQTLWRCLTPSGNKTALALGARAQTSFVNAPLSGGALGQPSAYLQ